MSNTEEAPQDPNDLSEDERLTLAFEAQEGQPEPPEDEPQGEESDQEEDAPASPPAVEEPSEEDRLSLLGRELDRDTVQGLLDFYDYIRSNPRQAVEIDAYMRGAARFAVDEPPPVEEQTEDAFSELDPALQAKLREIDEVKQQLAYVEQDRQARSANAAALAVQKGTENFQSRFSLTDEQVSELQQEAADLGIVPRLAEARGNMMTAVEEALEIAYWRNAKYRDLEMSRQLTQEDKDRKRQRKAAAVSGGAGSVSREQKFDETTPEGRRAAMAQMVRDAMEGGG